MRASRALVGLLLVAGLVGCGKTGPKTTVTGKVVFKGKGIPVGVLVAKDGDGKVIRSMGLDQHGGFKFDDLPVGTVHFSVQTDLTDLANGGVTEADLEKLKSLAGGDSDDMKAALEKVKREMIYGKDVAALKEFEEITKKSGGKPPKDVRPPKEIRKRDPKEGVQGPGEVGLFGSGKDKATQPTFKEALAGIQKAQKAPMAQLAKSLLESLSQERIDDFEKLNTKYAHSTLLSIDIAPGEQTYDLVLTLD